MGKSQDLYKKAKILIPGGTQLLSKRPEMFAPNLWPGYFSRSQGCALWDLDENKYLDLSYMGIGANILGYCDEDIDAAVIDAIKQGVSTTLNAPEEVELAELLCELHPWANMVRYAKTGGEAMAIAIRIARAKSKKDKVLFCGYHGWHDWYLAANLSDDRALDGHLLPGLNPLGVPRGLKGTAIPFKYNDAAELKRLLHQYDGEIGVVVLESIRNEDPTNEFVEILQELCSDPDIVVVFDEITAGWRQNIGGAHLLFDFQPDIAVFGKAISNGYPMAAIIGKADCMQCAQESFISSTYWTDRVGLVAALAAIKKMKKTNLPTRLIKSGRRAKEIWAKCAESAGLSIEISGIDPLGHFSFSGERKNALKTIFTQEMLKRGFLATTALYASLAHTEDVLNEYEDAVGNVFMYLSALGNDVVIDEAHTGFTRLT